MAGDTLRPTNRHLPVGKPWQAAAGTGCTGGTGPLGAAAVKLLPNNTIVGLSVAYAHTTN